MSALVSRIRGAPGPFRSVRPEAETSRSGCSGCSGFPGGFRRAVPRIGAFAPGLVFGPTPMAIVVLRTYRSRLRNEKCSCTFAIQMTTSVYGNSRRILAWISDGAEKGTKFAWNSKQAAFLDVYRGFIDLLRRRRVSTGFSALFRVKIRSCGLT